MFRNRKAYMRPTHFRLHDVTLYFKYTIEAVILANLSSNNGIFVQPSSVISFLGLWK